MKKILLLGMFFMLVVSSMANSIKVDTISQRTQFDDMQSEITSLKMKLADVKKDYEFVAGHYKDTALWINGAAIALITLLAGVLGALVPYLINRSYEKRLKSIEADIKAQMKGDLELIASDLKDTKAIKVDVEGLKSHFKKQLEDSEKAAKEAEEAANISKANKLFSEALNEKDLNRSIELYSKAIEILPDFTNSYINRGNAKGRLDQYQEAIYDYNKAIEIDPNNAIAYNNRGVAKNDLKEYKEAIKDFDKAILMNPEYAEAHFNRGNSKYYLQEHSSAINDYNKAIELNPRFSDAYSNRGSAKEVLQDYISALADYNTAIALQPNEAKLYHGRGAVKNNMQDYKGAITDYDKAIELNPKDADSYNNRSCSKLELGLYDEAITDVNMAIEIEPNNAFYIDTLGMCYRALKHFDEAIREHNKAINIESSKSTLYTERSNTYRAMIDSGQYNDNISEFTRLAEADEKRAEELKAQGK